MNNVTHTHTHTYILVCKNQSLEKLEKIFQLVSITSLHFINAYLFINTDLGSNLTTGRVKCFDTNAGLRS